MNNEDLLTDEELDEITKRPVNRWTIHERAKIAATALAVREARKAALEPFAKIAASFMADGVDRGMVDHAEYPGHEITVGMLRDAFRAARRRT